MKKHTNNTMMAMSLGFALTVSSLANADDMVKRTFCVFDPIGANGPLFSLMKSAKPAAMKWGVDLEMQAYTDEKIAAEDFKAGQCDSVLLTGTRMREFNKFTGSLDAIGAITSEEEMRVMMETLNQPKAKDLLKSGNYEVIGILPAGSVYLFLRDRNVDKVEKLQGKKVATLDYDNAAVTMVRHVGASVVGASSANFAGKFNNGSVDVAYAPAVAYTPLELYKGLEGGGGIFNYKLAQMNFQIVMHADRFPANYGDQSRAYSFARLDEAYDIIRKAEAEIDPKYWMKPNRPDTEAYDSMLREVRISLRDEGTYDAKALKLMRKVRCKKEPTRAECAEERE